MRKTEPHSRSRLTKILALLCCVALLVGSLAIFTDRLAYDTKGNIGKINLNFTDISSSKTGANGIKSENEFALDKAWSGAIVSPGGITNPGDVFDLSYSIRNTGSKSMDVRQRLTLKTSVPMTEGEEAYRITVTAFGQTVEIPGVLSQDGQSLTYDFPDYVLNGTYELENGSLGTKIPFIVRLDFLFEAGNEYMGSGLKVTYGAQAKQHRNTTDEHWASWAEYETSYGVIEDDPDDTPVITSIIGNTYMMSTGNTEALVFCFAADGTVYIVNTDLADPFDTAVSAGSYSLNGKNLAVSFDSNLIAGTVSDDWTSIAFTGAPAPAQLDNETFAFDGEYIYMYNAEAGGYVAVAANPNKSSYAPISTGFNGYATTTLYGTYAGNENLETVSAIPEGVTSLIDTFYSCTNLTNVTLPASIQYISQDAFYGCNSLTDIYYAGSESQWNDIEGSWRLDDVTIHFKSTGPVILTGIKGNAYVQVIDGEPIGIVCVSETGNNLYVFGMAGEFFVPGTYTLNGLTLTGSVMGQTLPATISADYRTVTVPGYDLPFVHRNDMVTFDEEYAYIEMDGVCAVLALNPMKTSFSAIPATHNGVPVSALYNTFANCSQVQSVSIPSSIQYISDDAFMGCDNLTDLYYDGTPFQWSSVEGTENVPDVVTIHYNTSGMETLTGLVGNSYVQMYDGFPGAALTFVDQEQAYVFGLAGSFYLPATYTVNGSTVTATITVPGVGTQSIPTTVSADWTTISVPGYGDFLCDNDCVVVDGDYGYIYDGSSYRAVALNMTQSTFDPIKTQVNGFPVDYLSHTYYGNSQITQVPEIPEGVTGLYRTFYGCTGLQSVTLPNSISSIGYETFYGCMALTDIYYAGTEAEWNDIYISDGNDILANVTIHFNSAG